VVRNYGLLYIYYYYYYYYYYVLFYVLFDCVVLYIVMYVNVYYCHRVSTQFQSNISYHIIIIIIIIMGRDTSVSIATRYGLDGPGIESR
jgi:hypothetical protein